MIKTLFKNYPPELYEDGYHMNNKIVSAAIKLTQKLHPGRLEYLISKVMPSNDIVGGIQNLTIKEVVEKLTTCNYLTLNNYITPNKSTILMYESGYNYITLNEGTIFPYDSLYKEDDETEFTTMDILCYSNLMSIYDFNEDETVTIVNRMFTQHSPICVATEDILKNAKTGSGLSLVLKSLTDAPYYPVAIIDKVYARPCSKVTYPYLGWLYARDYEEKTTIEYAECRGFRSVKIIK